MEAMTKQQLIELKEQLNQLADALYVASIQLVESNKEVELLKQQVIKQDKIINKLIGSNK